MKNRRNIIIAFLLCASLIVGVGYAALAENLVVDGSLAFFKDNTTGLETALYFNGNHKIVDASHNDITNAMKEAIQVNVFHGQQTASINAQFTRTALDDYFDTSSAKVGVILEIELASTTEDYTVEFGEISTNGAFGSTETASSAEFSMNTTVL